jgi:hypothetical protein
MELGRTRSSKDSEAGLELESGRTFQLMSTNAVPAALAGPRGLKPRGISAARRKERGSGGKPSSRGGEIGICRYA